MIVEGNESVRLVRREVLASPAEIDMQSFKCCGLKPSGPALEPWGKEEFAACTWA